MPRLLSPQQDSVSELLHAPSQAPIQSATTEQSAVVSQRIAIGRWRVHYVTAGAGEPVVLIHGFGASHRWWRYSLPVLASSYCVYAIDLPGFGRTSRPGRFAIADAVEMITTWMSAVGIDHAHVVGHSLGGQVALSLALRHPHKVDRLILADATGLPLARPLWQLAWQGLRSEFGYSRRFSVRRLAAALHSGPRVLWSASQAIMKEDLRQSLSDVDAPTLVVWGDQDRLVPLESGYAMASAIPGAELQVLAGGSHKAMIEQATTFNMLALRFLAATLS